VVWYSTGNRFAGNTVERSRYGTHFMYSHDNVVERGRFVDDVVGIFVMYSRNVTVRECLLARAGGAGGIGLGVKESGNLVVLDNRFVLDHVGVYVDTSPLDASEPNRFERNEFRLSQTAMVFHASPRWNTLVDNVFADNQSQVRVEGGGDALAVRWQGNDFDDYVGYDLDGDGFGDVPYQLRSLSGDLVSRFPVLEFHRGSLTLALIDAVSHLFPLFRPRTVLVDPRPRMAPTTARHGS
jgi:nitrous oxidase accessory protein